jgi:hypothetical protein
VYGVARRDLVLSQSFSDGCVYQNEFVLKIVLASASEVMEAERHKHKQGLKGAQRKQLLA